MEGERKEREMEERKREIGRKERVVSVLVVTVLCLFAGNVLPAQVPSDLEEPLLR
jgi:hypothetical protein